MGPSDIDAHRRASFQGLVDRFQHPWIGMHDREREAVPAPAQALPRGGHTELALERIVEQDARIRGGGLPACWSAYT